MSEQPDTYAEASLGERIVRRVLAADDSRDAAAHSRADGSVGLERDDPQAVTNRDAEGQAAARDRHRRRRDALLARGEDPAEHYSEEMLAWIDAA